MDVTVQARKDVLVFHFKWGSGGYKNQWNCSISKERLAFLEIDKAVFHIIGMLKQHKG
jgi:hypothetical protein